MENQDLDLQKIQITFIRHAQSLANRALIDFREKHQLPDCLKACNQVDEIYEQVIYNPKFCDCGISANGQIQCLQAKQKLKDLKIDLILVSPLLRALQTCQKVLECKMQNIECIVEPLLAETMKYSSDISGNINEKQTAFPKYNFQKLRKQGDSWYLQNTDEENKHLYIQHLKVINHQSFEFKQKSIANFMNLNRIRQSGHNLRKRVDSIKQLLQNYSEKYKNIVVVTHFDIIKNILAKKINSKYQTLDQFYGPNCAIYKQKLKNILKAVDIMN